MRVCMRVLALANGPAHTNGEWGGKKRVVSQQRAIEEEEEEALSDLQLASSLAGWLARPSA